MGPVGMASPKNLGLRGYDSAHFYVHDLDRARDFYVHKMDFAVVGRTSPETERETGIRTEVFGARHIRFAVSQSLRPGTPVAHYLHRHPEGAKRIAMRVHDLDYALERLSERKANLIAEPREERLAGGTYKEASITGPLGDVDYTFVQRGDNLDQWSPDVDPVVGEGGANAFGLAAMDHVTSNTRSMMSAVCFYREVLGFEDFWNIEFHTQDSKPDATKGSGLRSIVVADPDAMIKFATNEPKKPHFTQSQIQVFVDDNQGAGVQHIALATPHIIETVGGLRERDVKFLDAPDTYYQMLPKRMAERKVTIKEDIETLEDNRILVDGRDGRYLLQIFMKENAELFGDKKAGPFFHEIIQRRGDNGFGEGNFRALFESIEKDQGRRMSFREVERMVTVD